MPACAARVVRAAAGCREKPSVTVCIGNPCVADPFSRRHQLPSRRSRLMSRCLWTSSEWLGIRSYQPDYPTSSFTSWSGRAALCVLLLWINFVRGGREGPFCLLWFRCYQYRRQAAKPPEAAKPPLVVVSRRRRRSRPVAAKPPYFSKGWLERLRWSGCWTRCR